MHVKYYTKYSYLPSSILSSLLPVLMLLLARNVATQHSDSTLCESCTNPQSFIDRQELIMGTFNKSQGSSLVLMICSAPDL